MKQTGRIPQTQERAADKHKCPNRPADHHFIKGAEKTATCIPLIPVGARSSENGKISTFTTKRPVRNHFMLPKKPYVSFLTVLFVFVLAACQKELALDSSSNGGGGVLNGQKPRLGTTWTYNYNVYQQDGSLLFTTVLTYKAKTAEVLGGETWLKIVDVFADTIVFYLNEKPGGLFQYTNNASNLFCKSPAAVNDTYTAFNDGSSENFTVKAVGDTLSTGVGDIPANYYEGKKSGQLIDLLWYNENAWIVWKVQYRNRSILPPPVYYRYSSLYIINIVY